MGTTTTTTTTTEPDLSALFAVADGLHQGLAYRAGTIAQAAFRLAQFAAAHDGIEDRAAVTPELADALRGLAWNEPDSDGGTMDDLAELLRELRAQLRELALRAESLAELLRSARRSAA